MRGRLGGKDKARAWIDEFPDEPRRTHPIDLRIWPRQPYPATVLPGVQHAFRPASRVREAGRAFEEHLDVMGRGAGKIVDRAHFLELAPQLLLEFVEVISPLFAVGRDECIERFDERRVILGSRLVEQRDEFFTRQAFNRGDARECRVSPIVADLLHQPLEAFQMGRLIREQHVAGSLERVGPRFLQLSPQS